MGAEEGLDLLTRMAACSPEQLLSLFPFTSGYDVPGLGWCSRGDYAVEIQDGRWFTLCLIEKWQLWSATMLAVLLTILPLLSLFSLFSALEQRYPLILLGLLDSQISPDIFIFFPCSIYLCKYFCLVSLGIN